MSGKSQEKILGPYTIKLQHRGAVGETNKYEISVCFDKVLERRNPKRAKSDSAQLLDAIACELKKLGIETTKPQSFKIADMHLVSMACTAPKTMAEGDFSTHYQAACDLGVKSLSQPQAGPKNMFVSPAVKGQALMRGLKKHNIIGPQAEAIVADLLKELQQL